MTIYGRMILYKFLIKRCIIYVNIFMEELKMQKLEEMLEGCFATCDEIESAGVIKVNIGMKLRDSLKNDFVRFLSFLTFSDGKVEAEEIRFINDKFNVNVNANQLMALRPSSCAPEIPAAFKYFVLTDAGHKISGPDNNRARRLSDAYAMLGREFIAIGDDIKDEEIRCLTKYCGMLDKYLREFGLYAPVRKFDKDEIMRQNQSRLPLEKPVSLKEEDVEQILEELNSFIGLDSVKEDVSTIVNLLRIQKLRKERGMKQPDVSKHLVFSGNPGTGKTTVARMLGKVYAALGILDGGQLIEVDRSGLVSGYVGQTAMKTKDVIDSAIGGVLFIDEAYTLTAGKGENDFGQEAVDTILKGMEDHRDDLIVIVAGYPALMQEFLNSNPGLRSRFNKFIEFEDYTAEQIVQILKRMAEKQEYVISSDAEKKALEFFKKRIEAEPVSFANARDARNYLEKAMANQAGRIVNIENIDNDTLKLIIAEDLPESLV